MWHWGLPRNKSLFEFLRCFKQIPLYVFHLQLLPPFLHLKKCPKKCQLVTLDNSKEADCGRAVWLAKNLFQSCQEGQPGISYCWPCPAPVATKRTGCSHITTNKRQSTLRSCTGLWVLSFVEQGWSLILNNCNGIFYAKGSVWTEYEWDCVWEGRHSWRSLPDTSHNCIAASAPSTRPCAPASGGPAGPRWPHTWKWLCICWLFFLEDIVHLSPQRLQRKSRCAEE